MRTPDQILAACPYAGKEMRERPMTIQLVRYLRFGKPSMLVNIDSNGSPVHSMGPYEGDLTMADALQLVAVEMRMGVFPW